MNETTFNEIKGGHIFEKNERQWIRLPYFLCNETQNAMLINEEYTHFFKDSDVVYYDENYGYCW